MTMSHPLRIQRSKILLLEADQESCSALQSKLLPLALEVHVANDFEEAQHFLEGDSLLAFLVGPTVDSSLFEAWISSSSHLSTFQLSPLIWLNGEAPLEMACHPQKYMRLSSNCDGEELCHHLNVLCHLQEEVRVLKKELEELYCIQEDLNEFVSLVAHDIRSPLTLVMGYTDLLTSYEDLNEEVRGFLETINVASKDMATFLNSLEFYSVLRSQELSYSKLKVLDLVKDAIQELELEMKWDLSWLELDIQHEIEGDDQSLKEMFKALLKNGVMYQKADGPQCLKITSKQLGERRETLVSLDKPLVLFEVVDEGMGFEAKYKEQIFQPLKRLVGGSRYPGHGLGLASARRIVLRHGGTLTARSELGKGSRFYVTIPQRQADRLSRL